LTARDFWTFRTETLKLSPLTLTDGAALLDDHEVPFTYLWPESLVPKPEDWGPHIDLANFISYEQAQTYEPPQALRDFLAAGEPPIYVGFGSVVIDPVGLTVPSSPRWRRRARGHREGWAHLGGGALPPACGSAIARTTGCSRAAGAVCHHGGAGTTSAGLRAGLPTIVVPFFGDQFFWGRIVANARGGADPIRHLDTESLTAAFDACRRPQIRGGRRAPPSCTDGSSCSRSSATPGARHVLLARSGASGRAQLRPCRTQLCEEVGARAHAPELTLSLVD
jgi:hypothetical protein